MQYPKTPYRPGPGCCGPGCSRGREKSKPRYRYQQRPGPSAAGNSQRQPDLSDGLGRPDPRPTPPHVYRFGQSRGNRYRRRQPGHFYFSHRPHRPHTTASSDPDLEPYTGVPLKLSDLICLLSGQIPVQPFHHAWFSPQDINRIQLTGRFASQFQELIQAPDQPLKTLRLKNRQNKIRYEIKYHAFDVIDSRLIPVDLTIADGRDRQVRMTISRFWSDIPVKESVFQLTPFGS